MEAAERIGVHIPRLCYHPDLSLEGSCRVCIVDVRAWASSWPRAAWRSGKGWRCRPTRPRSGKPAATSSSCSWTTTPQIARPANATAIANFRTWLTRWACESGSSRGSGNIFLIDDSSHSVVRNPEKCILCGRCVRVCAEIQGVYNLSQHGRGFHTVVGPAHLANMDESVCIQCGQCINVCPTAAFLEKSATEDVWKALADPEEARGGADRTVQSAPPSARVSDCRRARR